MKYLITILQFLLFIMVHQQFQLTILKLIARDIHKRLTSQLLEYRYSPLEYWS